MSHFTLVCYAKIPHISGEHVPVGQVKKYFTFSKLRFLCSLRVNCLHKLLELHCNFEVFRVKYFPVSEVQKTFQLLETCDLYVVNL